MRVAIMFHSAIHSRCCFRKLYSWNKIWSLKLSGRLFRSPLLSFWFNIVIFHNKDILISIAKISNLINDSSTFIPKVLWFVYPWFFFFCIMSTVCQSDQIIDVRYSFVCIHNRFHWCDSIDEPTNTAPHKLPYLPKCKN